MTKSKIEWTDEVWNPVTGCTKVSQGCKHCYAERIWPRFYGKQEVCVPTPEADCIPHEYIRPKDVTGHWTCKRKFTDVQCHPERLEHPLRWKRPRMVFVNSMSDLFHEDVSFDFIERVFDVMADSPSHTFQVLTKRPDRMLDFITHFDRERVWPVSFPLPNVWLGVSVEDQATADERIPLLLQTPAAVRWISAEPLLGGIDLTLDGLAYSECSRCAEGEYYEYDTGANGCPHCYGTGTSDELGLDWVVVGGESGPRARPMHPDWARLLRDQCEAAGVPFFFKQWGEWFPVSSGHHGRIGAWSGGKFYENGADIVNVNNNMVRAGKKSFGYSLLDGVEHKAWPEIQA